MAFSGSTAVLTVEQRWLRVSLSMVFIRWKLKLKCLWWFGSLAYAKGRKGDRGSEIESVEKQIEFISPVLVSFSSFLRLSLALLTFYIAKCLVRAA